MDEALLSRIEDAGLNASAPPQQRWLDGWLLRYLPGKARRARCINALMPGRQPVAHKLALAEAQYQQAGLPPIFRITRFTAADTQEAWLQQQGFDWLDPTDIMACGDLPSDDEVPLPPGAEWLALGPQDFAEAVGALRGTPPAHRETHAQRLQWSPVPYRGFALRWRDDGLILACGQFAREADLVGLYDVFTHPQSRNQGLSQLLCKRLLSIAAHEGARQAYLQVEHENHAAQSVYRRLGFAVVDGYHYRQRPASV